MFYTHSGKDVTHRLPSETTFTEDYFKTLLEKPSHLIIEQMIHYDKAWKSTDEICLLDEMLPVEVENKVTDYRNGVLHVQQGIIGKKLEFISNKFIEVNGTQTGKMEVEAGTGMLLKKDVNIHLYSKVKIGPIEQLITVEDSTIINGVRK